VILDVQDICKNYGPEIRAVDSISFSVAAGEIVALVGESGCGKTTTLKCINRLVDRTSGSIAFMGTDVEMFDPPTLRRQIGWVMQGDGLFPHLTVAENIAVTPRLLGADKTTARARACDLITSMGLSVDEHADRLPDTLSGGQRQRVGIARALAAQPPLLLLDEPFGALDPITRDRLRGDFKALQARLGFAAILVTHDMAEALLLADRIVVMKEGRALTCATPRQLLADPGDSYVESLIETPRRQARAVEALEQGNA
tara:strand:- start:1232 stop:2002 length:771 start_codon:yes stop_codon:yes gene_type:complete